MKIAIPVAEFHRGNTSEYVARALVNMGHEATIIGAAEFGVSFQAKLHDLFFCVDSGGTFDFSQPPFANADLSNVGFWFIDYRHHADGKTRKPGDLANAKLIDRCGGRVFQAQREDFEQCRHDGVQNVTWLPLAADPEVWTDAPAVNKIFDIGFVGNVWDRGRASALELLVNSRFFKIGFKGHGGAWKEEGAALLRQCRVGFNISSYFGTDHAFDVNMRVFETLSCGLPIITNAVPALTKIFPRNAPYIRTFTNLEELLYVSRGAMRNEEFLSSGPAARQFILDNATYEHRMTEMLRGFPQFT